MRFSMERGGSMGKFYFANVPELVNGGQERQRPMAATPSVLLPTPERLGFYGTQQRPLLGLCGGEQKIPALLNMAECWDERS